MRRFNQWRLRKRSRQLAASCKIKTLKKYLNACAQIKPERIDQTPLIAVDLELTGLDAQQNKIISIGWTLIDNGRIKLGSNQHLIISADHLVGDSATIHQLLDNEVVTGIPIEAGLSALFEAAAGRIWLFHHADLDVAFIQVAAKQWAEQKEGSMPMMTLDTLQIELATRKRREIPVKPGDLQLGHLRRYYHLPEYKGHNALIDALATAELMLAMAARLSMNRALDLQPYVKFV